MVELGCGSTKRIRLDTTDEDQRTGYNRAERIRQHAPGSKAYQSCYGWREDSESWNNTLDRTLYCGRIITHTWEGQLLLMFGFMLARKPRRSRVQPRKPAAHRLTLSKNRAITSLPPTLPG